MKALVQILYSQENGREIPFFCLADVLSAVRISLSFLLPTNFCTALNQFSIARSEAD